MPQRLPVCLALLVATAHLSAAEGRTDPRQLARDAVIVDTHIDAPGELMDGWRDLGELTMAQPPH